MAPANFMEPGVEGTPENIGNILAAQKAKDRFQPYTEEPISEDEETPAPGQEAAQAGYQTTAPPEPEQETGIAAAMASDVAQKRAALRKIAAQKSAIDKQLAELEKELENIRRPKGGLTSFLKLNPFDLLDFVMPSLSAKINNAYNSVKDARGKQKIAAIDAAIKSLKVLKAFLIIARLVAGVIDAIFKWFSWCMKTPYLGPGMLVALPLLIILIPIIWPVLAVIYIAFEFGGLTSEIKALRKKINETVAKLEKELANEKKKMALRRQRDERTAQEQALLQPTPSPASSAPATPKPLPQAPPLPPQQKLAA